MAVAAGTILRNRGFTFFFAREVKWAIAFLEKGAPVPDARLAELLALGLDKLAKFPDGAAIHASGAKSPVALELEWSEKSADHMARQTRSSIAAGQLGIAMAIGYVHPPTMQKAIMERRARFSRKRASRDGGRSGAVPQTPEIDHETRLVNALHARAAPAELAHIGLLRMHFDVRLQFVSYELITPATLQPRFTQAIGTLPTSKVQEPDWSEPQDSRDKEGLLLGWDLQHRPSGCWLRLAFSDDTGWSGWEFFCWMESRERDGATLQVDYPDRCWTERLATPQERSARWSFEKALRQAKIWFLQIHNRHLARLARREPAEA